MQTSGLNQQMVLKCSCVCCSPLPRVMGQIWRTNQLMRLTFRLNPKETQTSETVLLAILSWQDNDVGKMEVVGVKSLTGTPAEQRGGEPDMTDTLSRSCEICRRSVSPFSAPLHPSRRRLLLNHCLCISDPPADPSLPSHHFARLLQRPRPLSR